MKVDRFELEEDCDFDTVYIIEDFFEALKAVTENEYEIDDEYEDWELSDELSNSVELFEKAVEINPMSLKHASKSVLKEKKIFLNAVSKDINVFGLVVSNGHAEYPDVELYKRFIIRNPSHFKTAPKELRKDREFVIQVLQNDHKQFAYLSDSMKKDEEFLNICFNDGCPSKGYKGK